ncbi:MAG: single-stranded-DNA-specific exonuclease RecJ [Nitrospirae bacterium]|nr:MAG: single-stranded-DNA-specific exonuclease RecJ [Nitrospirota bacterium]
MLDDKRRWIVSRTNSEYVEYLSKAVSVSVPFAQILINRGIKSPQALSAFLDPSVSKFSDPFDIKGISAAVERIRLAKSTGELVLIHGDYDADGVSATAIMLEGLRLFGVEARYFIPNRITHGYGFGNAGVDKARSVGAKLIITVDCGITSFDAVSAANALGMDVIITDHHEAVRSESGEPLVPDAAAVVNPKLDSGIREWSCLSGAGVALKIIQALFRNNSEHMHRFFDLAAIGTGADVVPVLDDNRIILKEGLGLIQAGERPGIKAIKESAGIKADFFKASFLPYIVVPRINAAGRIADASDVVELLTTNSYPEAERLAVWLNGLNLKRQEIEQQAYSEALAMLRTMDTGRGALVLASEGWHQGVVGIVASRVQEEFNRPVFVLSIENGLAKGSGRSIPSFDMHSGLFQCRELLKRFGGHKQAAGLALASDDIGRFREKISGIVENALAADDFVPSLNIDAAVKISDMSLALAEEISRLEPFGYGNEAPLLGAKGLNIIQPRIVGKNHLKMYLRQNGTKIDSIGFDLGGALEKIDESSLVDIAFQPTVNDWNGGRFLQLNLKALRKTSL